MTLFWIDSNWFDYFDFLKYTAYLFLTWYDIVCVIFRHQGTIQPVCSGSSLQIIGHQKDVIIQEQLIAEMSFVNAHISLTLPSS